MRARHITVSTPCPNLAGCGLLTDGRLNPFNCFGQSEPREPPIEQTVANTARSSKVSLAVYVSGIKLNSVRQIAVFGDKQCLEQSTVRWLLLLHAVILPLAVLLPQAVLADPVRMDFPASDASLTNPERGFWKFAANDFLKVDPAELANIRSQGLSLAYTIVRLDDYRDATLPQPVPDALQRSFGLTRQAGLKVILRFAYNYPQTSTEYETAEDAALPVVLGHIAQLGPVIAANADTLAVVQAGFIGAWGESHSSSNRLDSPAGKAAVRDAPAAGTADA